MKHRHAPHRVAAARAWDRFVSANAPVIAASGTPTAYVASIDHVDDFLTHGFLAHHPDDTDFRIESMSEERHASLVVLVGSYFVAGYEWLRPAALRLADQRRLASRFGAPGAG